MPRTCLLLLFVALLCQPPSKAEENLDDLFGEMESAPTEKASNETAKKKPKAVLQLIRNLKPTLNLTVGRYRYSPKQKATQTSRHIWAGNLTLETQANIGKDLLFAEVWTEYSNLKDAYRPNFQLERDQGKDRRSIQFNQFYYTKAMGKTDVTLGKMLIESGTCELFSPADRFSRGDGVTDTFAHAEGVWALQLAHFRGPHTFTAAILPVFEQPRGISKYSRWSLAQDTESGEVSNAGRSILGLPADVSDGSSGTTATERFPEACLKNIQMMTGWQGKFKGLDLFVTGYHGYSPNKVSRQVEDEYFIEYVKSFDLMAGFSATIRKWEFHGESVSRFVYGDEDDDIMTTVFGTTYTLDDLARKLHLKSIEFTAEYAWEHILNDHSDTRYPQSTIDGRLGRDSLFWRATVECTEKVEVFSAYSMDWHAEYDTWAVGFKKRFNDKLKLNCWAEIYGASDNSKLRPWIHNDRYRASLEYTF